MTRDQSIPRFLLFVFATLVSAQAIFAPRIHAQELEDEGVTIQASPPQDTTAKKVVSKENIEKSGSRDLAELLQDTLNLGTLSYGGYGNSASVN
ncbi:MAG: hypothetical protein LBL06_02215, partial [Treponema sp.]|nr:hypothetical protein [Treponema sp.]